MKGYHFLSSKYGLEAIRDQRIKVSKLDDLNDPFEFHSVQLGDKEVRERFNEFLQEAFRETLVTLEAYERPTYSSKAVRELTRIREEDVREVHAEMR